MTRRNSGRRRSSQSAVPPIAEYLVASAVRRRTDTDGRDRCCALVVEYCRIERNLRGQALTEAHGVASKILLGNVEGTLLDSETRSDKQEQRPRLFFCPPGAETAQIRRHSVPRDTKWYSIGSPWYLADGNVRRGRSGAPVGRRADSNGRRSDR
jgi:hypothetical protein